jgi:hypothetical protein
MTASISKMSDSDLILSRKTQPGTGCMKKHWIILKAQAETLRSMFDIDYSEELHAESSVVKRNAPVAACSALDNADCHFADDVLLPGIVSTLKCEIRV